jgi:hypothetical protein
LQYYYNRRKYPGIRILHNVIPGCISFFIKTSKRYSVWIIRLYLSKEIGEFLSVSLKGIPTDQGHALKEVAKARDINQSALLREMVNASMGSILVFCIKARSSLPWIRIFAQYNASQVLPAWNSLLLPPSLKRPTVICLHPNGR